MNIWIFLTLSNVEFPLKVIIQDLQNDQNCRFCAPKSAKFDFHKVKIANLPAQDCIILPQDIEFFLLNEHYVLQIHFGQ